MHERAVDPIAEVISPRLGHMLYAVLKGVEPIMVHRDYHASRSAVSKAMEPVPKLDAWMAEIDVGVGIGVLMMKHDHEILR